MPDTEMVTAQVARERRWVYECWMDHIPLLEMRRLSLGALGYELGESAIKGLLRQAQSEAGVLEVSKAAETARELEDIERETITVDASIGRLRQSMEAAADLGTYDYHGEVLLDKHLARRAALRDQRIKLLGLNAPEKSEVTVTHRDAVTDELNAQLAALDLPPIREEVTS